MMGEGPNPRTLARIIGTSGIVGYAKNPRHDPDEPRRVAAPVLYPEDSPGTLDLIAFARFVDERPGTRSRAPDHGYSQTACSRATARRSRRAHCRPSRAAARRRWSPARARAAARRLRRAQPPRLGALRVHAEQSHGRERAAAQPGRRFPAQPLLDEKMRRTPPSGARPSRCCCTSRLARASGTAGVQSEHPAALPPPDQWIASGGAALHAARARRRGARAARALRAGRGQARARRRERNDELGGRQVGARNQRARRQVAAHRRGLGFFGTSSACPPSRAVARRALDREDAQAAAAGRRPAAAPLRASAPRNRTTGSRAERADADRHGAFDEAGGRSRKQNNARARASFLVARAPRSTARRPFGRPLACLPPRRGAAGLRCSREKAASCARF